MYKLLLCWRYLKTRYLALACIISVMLGVATLIVVNSVMSGFSTKLRDTLHGLLSDVVIEGHGLEGFGNPKGMMARIRQDEFLGPRVEAMSATMEIFAMMQYEWPFTGEIVTRTVRVVGVDAEERGAIGGFKEFLEDPANKDKPTFELPPELRLRLEENEKRALNKHQPPQKAKLGPLFTDEPPPPVPAQAEVKVPKGAFVGKLIASFKRKKMEDRPEENADDREIVILRPGDTFVLTTVSGQALKPVYDRFAVVDYFKSEMSEYDSNFVFVPLDYLQHLRTMDDRVTSLQIKLKDYDRDAREVVTALRRLFPDPFLSVNTWEDKQGALLAAISIEKGILNILLFLIIAVAGFGILAIFSMIVAEKTRDIGILKALGASNGGVLKIFLGYGLLLGLVGALCGSGLGCFLTDNINGVEQFLGGITGKDLFPRDLYYFKDIPTDLQVSMLWWVNIGAVGIAVLFSVLPALRAARLHPVRALRYE